MNVFTFDGNLGRDPQLNNVNGTPVLNFSVGFKSGYGQHQQTVWADCALWGKRAETMANMLHKGKYVVVTGEVGEREFARQDGSQGKALTVRVADLSLGPRQEQQGHAQAQGGYGGGQQQGGHQQPPQQQQQRQQQPSQGQQGRFGAPAAGSFDDFDDEIPFSGEGA